MHSMALLDRRSPLQTRRGAKSGLRTGRTRGCPSTARRHAAHAELAGRARRPQGAPVR